MNERLDLDQLRSFAKQGGGEKRVQAQHAKGKMTARERLELLLDPETFVETDMFVTPRHGSVKVNGSAPENYTDGVITGWGKIDDRLVYVYAQDFTILGGSLGESHGLKIARLIEQVPNLVFLPLISELYPARRPPWRSILHGYLNSRSLEKNTP